MFHAHNWELYDGSSGVHTTALTRPPAPAANDPNDIADSDQARYEPQQHAGGRVERKTDAQPQCEDQKGGDDDCRMQDDSQYNHAAMILQQARWYADVSTRSGQSSGLTRPGLFLMALQLLQGPFGCPSYSCAVVFKRSVQIRKGTRPPARLSERLEAREIELIGAPLPLLLHHLHKPHLPQMLRLPLRPPPLFSRRS